MASTAPALQRRRRSPSPVSVPQFIALLVVFLGMVLVGNYLFRRTVGDGTSTLPAFQTSAAARRTISSTVSVTGTVSATKQIKATFPSAGQVQEVLVKQGDRVQAGQPLATLNTFSLEVKRDQARTNLSTAQFRLDALLAGPTSADLAAAQQTVATAQSTLTSTQNTLYNLLAGASADDIAAARAVLDRAQANLAVAQANWDKLTNRTDLTLRPEYATLQTAKSAYQQALTNFQTKTAPPNPLDVSNVQAQVQTAQSSLDSARSKLTQVLAGSDPLDIANARNLVTSAQAALDAAQAKLRDLQNPTGATAIELAALEAQVTAARSNLASAQAAQTESLLGGAASDTRAKAEASIASAQAALLTAQNNLAKAQAGTVPGSADLLAAQQGVTTAQTTLLNAQNNVQKLLQGPSAADIATAQQGVTAAESQLQTARNNLDKLLAGNSAEDIAAATAALTNAQSVLDTAQVNWDRLNNGTDLETRSEYTALIAARTEYQTALSSYNTKTQGPKPGDVAAAQASVDAANASVNSALAKFAQVQGGSLSTDIGVAREAVINAELALKQAQNDIDSAAIKAPFAGTVVAVGVSSGDQVTPTTAAFTLLDPDLVRIDASVDESNVVKLRTGMPATVTFDALQGQIFQGVVANVTPSGVTQQGVVTFPVTAVFNTQGYSIPPGTSASLRIVVESKPNVIAVPSRAVQRQGRTSFVQVLEDGKPVDRQVQTGITGDSFTEITDGLQDGDQVIIPSTQNRTGTGQQGALGTSGLGGAVTIPVSVPAPPAGR